MVEETLANLFLDWKSLVLVFFILGVGYVGLFYVCALRKNDIFHDIVNCESYSTLKSQFTIR